MTQADFTILRSGFDTLELAYGAALPEPFLDVLEDAKAKAAQSRRAEPVSYRGADFLVEASGAQGGYAYRVSTGPFGAIWTFRDKSSRDPWTTHVKLRAYGLATKGLIQAKADCDDLLKRIGSVFDADDARVSRADFAIDVHYPAFVLRTAEFVAHARTSNAEVIDRHGNAEICNYARFGKLPGKQLCIYQKAKKVIGEKDLIWADLLHSALSAKDLPQSAMPDIWRFEFRAGRDAISDRLGLRRWDRFLSNRREVFSTIAKAISWRIPSLDSNRARWAIRPAWQSILDTLKSDVGDSARCEISPRILDRLRKEHIEGLEAQLVGLTLSRAAFEPVPVEALPQFASSLGRRTTSALLDRPDLHEELTKRRQRAAVVFSSYSPT